MPRRTKWYGLFLDGLGRFDEGRRALQRALEVDPLSLIIISESADPDRYQRRYGAAISQTRKALDMDVSFWPAHMLLVSDYVGNGDFSSAAREAERAVELSNGGLEARAMLAYAYARSGEHERALAIARDLEQLRNRQFASAYYLAVIYAGLGDRDNCIHWLEESYKEKSILNDNDVLVNPLLDPVRSDSRYTDLLRRLRLR